VLFHLILGWIRSGQ